MLTLRNRIGGVLAGALVTFSCVAPALADDSEIYTSASTNNVQPNILFIVDTSGSMGETDVPDERKPYNYQKSGGYATADNCTSGRIFFRADGDPMPDCKSENYILADTSKNNCLLMTNATSFANGISGRWTGKAAQYDQTNQIWRDLQPKGTSDAIECAAESGKHGATADPTGKPYARNGDKNNKWSSNSAASIDWSQRKTYTFYSSNWLNWRREEKETSTLSRLTAVKQSVIDMASSIDGVNLGLMRYSNNGASGEYAASGGYVAAPVIDVEKNRAAIISSVNSYAADGYTPLAETLWEAYSYFGGKAVDFGASSKPGTSVGSARVGGSDTATSYQSPIIGQCQKNFVIYLTDGLPTRDQEANGTIAGKPSRIKGLIGKSCLGPQVGDDKPDDGLCLDDLAGYMYNNDIYTGLDGPQTVTTYTIGFGKDIKGATLLDDVAKAGGGKRFDASGTDELTEALTAITNDVLNVSTTFSTASVGVNAFNRTQTRSDLYFALFAPKETLRWDGNLKKFKLAVDKSKPDTPVLIITGQGAPTNAVDDATGRFKETTQSFWSDSNDGNDVTVGGAAENLPDAAARKVYTFLGTNPKGSSASLLPLNDSSVTAAILNVATGTPTRDQLLDFAYAKDAKRLGDPLHSEPAVVTYGGTPENPTDVVFVATNDGYIHAIDAADDSGAEKWSFVPRELLARLRSLYLNEATPNRTYGLDGDIRVIRLDRNDNGVIESSDGDRVWLYVGMRRGGKYYYALDVTDPDNPKMMWIDGAEDPNSSSYTILPKLAETWSAPTVARVNIAGATQNNQKLVLIFGGGYDANQEAGPQIDDATGNRVFMVDAKTGALLWYAAPDATGTGGDSGKLLTITDMKNSIPGRITVVDTNGDLYADRMYAADMGGRIFRFDIFNGNGASTLVTGGVFAELGQGQVVSPATPVLADTRRFYNAPDVALIQRRGEDPYYNIAIGSGYRGHPLSKDMVDRFYSVRDKQPFMKLSNTAYASLARIKDSDLIDITADPNGAVVKPSDKGWKYLLGTTGQKVLAQSSTVNDVILFSTFEPDAPTKEDPCRPRTKNRAYALSVDNGHPALDLNKDGVIDNKDVSQLVAMDGILGKINVGVLRGELGDDLQSGKNPTPGPPTVCLAGMHVLGSCVQVNDSVRTYWRRDNDIAN